MMLHAVNGLLPWVTQFCNVIKTPHPLHQWGYVASDTSVHMRVRNSSAHSYSLRNLWVDPPPQCGGAPCWTRTHSAALRSECTVPQGEPSLLVKQLLLQSDVGCTHKSLLALHCHFQHHPIQQWDIMVLYLWIRGRYLVNRQLYSQKTLIWG